MNKRHSLKPSFWIILIVLLGSLLWAASPVRRVMGGNPAYKESVSTSLAVYLPIIFDSVSPTTTSTPTSTATSAPTNTPPNPTATQTPTSTTMAPTLTPIPTQGGSTPTPTPTAVEGDGLVIIGDFLFIPHTLTVHVGANVVWQNADPVDHTTTSDTGVWDSGTIVSGGSYQFQFTDAGNFPYHDTLHPNITGTIIVVP